MSERYRIKLSDGLLTGVSTREREKLAKSTKNGDILRELAKSKNLDIRGNVAENPNTSEDILRELAKDDYVRANVAENINCPIDVLRKLSEDENYWVRRSVARNKNTPVEVLKKFFEDEDEYVIKAVASNPNTPIDILKKLAEDEDEDVRRGLAKNPNTPVDILRKLSRDVKFWRDFYVRGNVAENPSTPQDILRNLAEDEDFYVLECVASNPNTPLDALKKLVENKDGISITAKKNPTFKKYIKSLNLSELDEIDYIPYDEKRELAKATKNVDVLRKLAISNDLFVREAVARNTNTPVDVLNTLAKDRYSSVRRNAKNNPNYKKSEKQQPELSTLTPSQIRNRIFKGSKESRIEALKYALDNVNKFDNSLFELVAELDVPYLNEVLETHPNTPDELFEEE